MEKEIIRGKDPEQIVFTLGGEDPNGYELRMLQRGQIPGLLPSVLRSVDGERQLCYERAGMRTLRESWAAGRIGEKEIRQLSEAVTEMLRQLSDHLLPTEGLLLAPEFVFQDCAGRFLFCCSPGRAAVLRESILTLADYLLPRLDREDREGVLLGYTLCQRALETGGSPEIFRQMRSSSFPALSSPEAERMLTDEEEVRLPPAADREKLLDDFFAPEEEVPPMRLKLWQQRILVVSGAAAAVSCILGALFGQMFIGAGGTIIAAAAGAYVWLKFARRDRVFTSTRDDMVI